MNEEALAARSLALIAVDPHGLGGALLRAPHGPERDGWLAGLREMMPPILPLETGEGDRRRRWRGLPPASGMQVEFEPHPIQIEAHPPPPPCSAWSPSPAGAGEDSPVPWRRMPPGIGDGRLLGGLDLAATLAAGRPVAERGLLAEADGGVLIVPMAERLEGGTAGHVAAALDAGEIVVERDGLASRAPARFGCILLDEGEGDEHPPDALAERVAFRLDAAALRAAARAAEPPVLTVTDVAAARERLPAVGAGDDEIEAICAAGLAFGVPSLRVATFALRAAKAAAALAGREAVSADDVALAAALVIAPRATALPASAAPEDDESAEPEDPSDGDNAADREHSGEGSAQPDGSPEIDKDDRRGDVQNLADRVVEATRAAIPAGLLAMLSLVAGPMRRPATAGRAGVPRLSVRRGRPAGTRRGTPGPGARLAIVATLRAAAPWQPLRRGAQASAGVAPAAGRILVRKDDFRVARTKQRGESVTIFVVDASGSAALHRLAEVKGAVELILAECYVRRDSVALIAFRGSGAELILPPTRSLARAKRALAGQAGGGGTPLAAALEAATLLADGVRRKGRTPLCVFLTDGKANVGLGRRRGRAEAEADAQEGARAFRAGGCASLVLDIAPRPGAASFRLAAAMGARYQPLPYAEARDLSRLVLDAATADRRRNI